MGNDDFMGERIIELGRLDFNEVITGWYDMQAEVRGCISQGASMHYSLYFVDWKGKKSIILGP